MVSFIYDDLGNHPTQDDTSGGGGGKGYFYDRQNMLTRVEDAQGELVMRYAYDAFNRLVEREAGYWPYAMYYNYDGWRRLEECPGDDPGAHRTFIWTPGSAGYIDDLLACVSSPGTTRYACRNHNFSVVAMLNTSGGVVERYDYNPYGERLVLDPDYAADADGLSDIDNPIGFQGLFHDDETGLIYVRNRYLKPTLGRWMTRDPAGYPDGLNAYAGYLAILQELDPLGLTIKSVTTTPTDPKWYLTDTRSYGEWVKTGGNVTTSLSTTIGKTGTNKLAIKFYAKAEVGKEFLIVTAKAGTEGSVEFATTWYTTNAAALSQNFVADLYRKAIVEYAYSSLRKGDEVVVVVDKADDSIESVIGAAKQSLKWAGWSSVERNVRKELPDGCIQYTIVIYTSQVEGGTFVQRIGNPKWLDAYQATHNGQVVSAGTDVNEVRTQAGKAVLDAAKSYAAKYANQLNGYIQEIEKANNH